MRKHNINIKTALAVFAVALSACSSDNDIVDNNSNNQEKPVAGKSMTFHASMEGDGDNATRTDFNSNSTVWATGDAISILNKATVTDEPDRPASAEFGITGGIGTKEADFEGGPIKANGNDADDFYAYYPSSSFDSNNEKMVGNIPTVQTATADGYDQSLHFMTAHSTNSTFEFKNVCALLKITLTDNPTGEDSNPVCRVKVVANPKLIHVYDSLFQYTSIAGNFEATVNTDGIATTTSTEAKKTYVELRAAADDDGTAKKTLGNGTFYMVVLPATISDGFTLLLERKDGTIYQRINTKVTSFDRNQMYNLGSYNCSSTPTGMTSLGNGNDVVDLDLPSGTIWCKRNMSNNEAFLAVNIKVTGFVDNETDYGCSVSFGKNHTTTTALYSSPSMTSQTLKGTEDIAYSYSPFNQKYCMPIFAQWYEFYNHFPDEYKRSDTTGNGYAEFTAPTGTGRKIKLPYAGHFFGATRDGGGTSAAYWSRTDYGTTSGVAAYRDAYCLDMNDTSGKPVLGHTSSTIISELFNVSGAASIWSDDHSNGRSVRPVVTNIKIAPIY